ncbi:hypothetical protein QQS21_009353 [Conoideocrella luteorostrata]|uniref:FAD/NAD(P)-binding domain-containing protein n=1 Tax=Conoideocrella luteorostrata TaxID=1105319 RepID=A0AAJ0FQD3_9HYPO|nr:hypothetical protein QQS21_009353 [Conoideocrella luteorostrata]
MTKTVVILGAGWAGLPLAHKLLKYTAVKVNLKVILISPNSHFFWNIAATRGLMPGEIPDSSMFFPITPGFSRYPAKSFNFILGSAESIDKEANSITVETNEGIKRVIAYDQLVIATGSRISSGLPLKPLGTHEKTLDAWHALQNRVKDAKTIIVGGGGRTGLEAAGELAARYGKLKEISIILSTAKPLGANQNINESVRDVLDNDLKKLGVKIIRDTKVQAAKKASDGNSWTIGLSNGNTLVADLYLPLLGIQVNTSFVPGDLLDASGNVKQERNLRVSETENIWALGDVGNTEPKELTVIDAQIVYLATALDAIMTGSGAVVDYQPANKTMLFLALGKKFATGQIGNWRLWGWMVSWVKGRKLFVDTADGYVGGEKLRHGSM